MANRREIAAVYATAVVQGITLVTFPAVSSIFTSSISYGLSTTEYGGMFIPQAIAAVLSSLAGAALTRVVGGKNVLLLGLSANLLSMLALFGSQFFMLEHAVAFALLLFATGCLGIGFGFAVPALNTFTAAFFPLKVDTAILTLNALLGVGTALAPIFALIFVGAGIWWGLPLLMSVLTLALLIFTWRLPLARPVQEKEKINSASLPKAKVSTRFWLYAAFALVYGICETLSGNWATVYLTKGLGASAALASLALTVFWATVTGGRIFFAVMEKWCPPRLTYRLLPFLIAAAFLGLALITRTYPLLAVVLFGVAGLGCSALLPLVISFGQGELATMGAAVAGSLIGFYQMGYGIAAFGVGPLQSLGHLTLSAIFASTSVVALMLAVLAFLIVLRHPHEG